MDAWMHGCMGAERCGAVRSGAARPTDVRGARCESQFSTLRATDPARPRSPPSAPSRVGSTARPATALAACRAAGPGTCARTKTTLEHGEGGTAGPVVCSCVAYDRQRGRAGTWRRRAAACRSELLRRTGMWLTPATKDTQCKQQHTITRTTDERAAHASGGAHPFAHFGMCVRSDTTCGASASGAELQPGGSQLGLRRP